MKNNFLTSAKECTYVALFVALVIGIQLTFTFLPGVELVTVLFVSYAFIMGSGRGMVAATAFSMLRQMVFGADLKVLVLYLVYFNALTALFGFLGKKVKLTKKNLLGLTLIACLCTASFTLLDNVLTPLWLGMSQRNAKLYFYASLPFMFPQILCTAISVGLLFPSLSKVFSWLKGNLKSSSRN